MTQEALDRLANWAKENCPKLDQTSFSLVNSSREVVLVIGHEMFGPVQFQLLIERFPELSLVVDQRQKHQQEIEEALLVDLKTRAIELMPEKESEVIFKKNRSYLTRKEKSKLPKWMRTS